MGVKFQQMIEKYNGLEEADVLTSGEFFDKFAEGIITRKNASAFMTITHKLGATERSREEGCKTFEYMKVRDITPEEKKSLTTYPDCIDFQKKLNKEFAIRKEAETIIKKKSTGLEVCDEKPKMVKVKSYKRKAPTKKKNPVKITVTVE